MNNGKTAKFIKKILTPPARIARNIFDRINQIDKNVFATIIIIAFAIVVGVGMHYHEMWRDELEWYLRRRYQPFFSEGDPCYLIYNFIIEGFLFINPEIWTFQLFHLMVIVGAIAILAFFSPFPNAEKLLIAFNYYFIYEYGRICRYYGFIVLIVFIIMTLLGKKKKNYCFIAIFILILAYHSVSAAIIGASITLYLLLDTFNKNAKKQIDLRGNWNLIYSAAILLIGWGGLIIIYYLFVLKLSFIFTGGTPPLFTGINQIWNSYFPLPMMQHGVPFWNTNIINYHFAYPPDYVFALKDLTWQYSCAFTLSLIIILIAVSKFIRKPIVLITFLANTLVYGYFMQHFIKVYAVRYMGLLFIIFIYSYWLYKNADGEIQIYKSSQCVSNKKTRSLLEVFHGLEKLFKPMLIIMLLVQVFSSFYAISQDFINKFSLSRYAAEFIQQNNLQDTHILVGYPDYAAQCISAYLDVKIFYPQLNVFGYYSNCLNKNQKSTLNSNELVEACESLAGKQNKKVLLILNTPIMEPSGDGLVIQTALNSPQSTLVNQQEFCGHKTLTANTTIKYINSFKGDVINRDEQFYLYEVQSASDVFLNTLH